jgi:ubiquitin-conjugating enzyme E2 R
MSGSAVRLLGNEFKALEKEKWTRIEMINDNIFEWSVALIVLNPDSLYYGGYFKAKMTFPKDYPYSPPGMCTAPHPATPQLSFLSAEKFLKHFETV